MPLVFTDERFIDDEVTGNLFHQPDAVVQVLFAYEVFTEALIRPDGLLVNTRGEPNLQLAPWHCRKIRRLLGRSGHGKPGLGPKQWPTGWPQPTRDGRERA